MVVVIIRHDTKAAARRTSLFIVRALVNDTITVAIGTGFHLGLHSSRGNAMGGRWRARDRLCPTVARPRDSEPRLHCAAVFFRG